MDGGALEDGAREVEAGAVAGTIPAALRTLEAQQATEVRGLIGLNVLTSGSRVR